jgi:hypothetical protein
MIQSSPNELLNTAALVNNPSTYELWRTVQIQTITVMFYSEPGKRFLKEIIRHEVKRKFAFSLNTTASISFSKLLTLNDRPFLIIHLI